MIPLQTLKKLLPLSVKKGGPPWERHEALTQIYIDLLEKERLDTQRNYSEKFGWDRNRFRREKDGLLEEVKLWLLTQNRPKIDPKPTQNIANLAINNRKPTQNRPKIDPKPTQKHNLKKEKESHKKEKEKNLSPLKEKTPKGVKKKNLPSHRRAQEEWNLLAEELNLPSVRIMSDRRKVWVRQRWGAIEKHLPRIYQIIRESNFLRGENDRGWRIDFDFLWGSTHNYVKILEGKYTEKQTNGKPLPQLSKVLTKVEVGILLEENQGLEREAFHQCGFDRNNNPLFRYAPNVGRSEEAEKVRKGK